MGGRRSNSLSNTSWRSFNLAIFFSNLRVDILIGIYISKIKMSSPTAKKLNRYDVGGLPLIEAILSRMGLREILTEALHPSGREGICSVEVLIMVVRNLAVAKDPLYELAEWIDALDLRPLGFAQRPEARFTDDRFGRALDKLYEADRASLQTELVLAVIRAFDVQLNRIHNDSTSVKACGRIPGRTRTGLELRLGYSKDHRPDLKQLVFCLSISADGAVPVHHRVYPGNRNDDSTHIETWNHLRMLHGRSDFLYVADGKLCSRAQLAHIVSEGGRAITIVPASRKEAKVFLDTLRAGPVKMKPVWRRPKPCDETVTEYFSLFEGACHMDDGGYPIHWFLSSEKRKRDRYSRQQRLNKAEKALSELALKLNTPRLATRAPIKKAFTAILHKHRVGEFITVHIATHFKVTRLRPRGRPKGEKVKYRIKQKAYYSLAWERNAEALKAERRVDGVFPLLCTDIDHKPLKVLQAWKYQPRLEKRFEQFKTVHGAAPLLFKKIERVEANMFLFFVALMAQALLERDVRKGLKNSRQEPLKLYPEDRDAPHPTTSQILKTFTGISTYQIEADGCVREEYRDDFKPVHHAVLKLLGISEEQFWGEKMEPKKTG